MFASQLLRILQTIPSNVKYETCVFDAAEQHMIMKENHDEALRDSETFGSHEDPLGFGNKEIYQLNDSKRDITPLAFEVKGNEYWNPFVDGFTMDTEDGTIDSVRERDQNELSYSLSNPEHASISFLSDSNTEGKVEELSHFDESVSRGSNLDFIPPPNVFEAEDYADKNVLEREVPELMVCYKEVNYHIVKDICVDEGMPVKEKRLNEASMNHHSNPESPNESAGGVDMEFFAPSPPSSKNSSPVYGTKHEDEEGNCGKIISQEQPRISSEISSDHGDDEDSVQQTGETNFSTAEMIAFDSSEKLSFVDRTLPIQEFGTRSFLRSFLNSLDGDRSEVMQSPDQISSGRPVSGSPTEAESIEDVLASSLLYNSKVESGSITFNFNSPSPAGTGITSGRIETLKEQSVVSGNSPDHMNLNSEDDVANGRTENVKEQSSINMDDHKNSNTDDHVRPVQVQCTSMEDKTLENVRDDSSLEIKDGNTNDVSPESNKNKSLENILEQSPEIKNDEHSANEQVQSVSIRNFSSTNNDGLVGEPKDPKHERRDSGGVSSVNQYSSGSIPVANHLQRDHGETSFSAAGLITYSEPVAYSGSLSIRSDGSATSGRSFAFPILQDEWNSSPVRMAKADRRHFRKHKGWRSGLLCCRF